MFIESYLEEYGTNGHDKIIIELLLATEKGEPVDAIVKRLGTMSADLRACLEEVKEKNAT